MSIRSIGYGAGDHDFKEHANIVRVMIGEGTGAPQSTTVSVIEANIDDASPQVIGWATEKLLEAGALDAVVISAQMKKNRPGVLLQVIAPTEKREELIALILRETTTLGVRFYSAERRVQAREWIEVTTTHGVVRMKTAPDGFAPEYEDARTIATATGLPLKQHPRRSRSRISQNPMKYYLTTPIYYVNAAPHIGHAYTTLAADTIKRLKTMQGYTTVLTTGTDEHGEKVERSAVAMGKTPEEFATIISNEFRAEWDKLGIRYDHFIRTAIRN